MVLATIRAQEYAQGRKRGSAGYSSYVALQIAFDACYIGFDEVFGQVKTWTASICTSTILSSVCLRAGLSEEESITDRWEEVPERGDSSD